MLYNIIIIKEARQKKTERENGSEKKKSKRENGSEVMQTD
jgi:hypothetical protein